MTVKIIIDHHQHHEWVDRWLAALLTFQIDLEIVNKIQESTSKDVRSWTPEPNDLKLWLTHDQYEWAVSNNVHMYVFYDQQLSIVFENAEHAIEFSLRWL